MTPTVDTLVLDVVASAIASVVRLVADPMARTFWPFLAVSIVAALWLRARERHAGLALPPHLDTFSRTTWWSASACNDYALVPINAVLAATVLAPAMPDLAAIAHAVTDATAALLPRRAATSAAWAPVALAAALFLADDLARYALHRLEHRSALLWEFHKVHHSAEAMNFVTAERHHPVSLVVATVAFGGTAAIVNALFAWAFGPSLSPAQWLGANAFWLAGNLLASSLRHSPAWIPFGRRLEPWLVSPAQHQLHHSDDPRHFGRNFGSTLAIWDRMFGTLEVAGRERPMLTFGLGDETPTYRTLRGLYLTPFARIASRARRRTTAVG
jgi:sterol desaturase/sphingolipid hydroxylase (fatty acid hydroxylase superfamily)